MPIPDLGSEPRRTSILIWLYQRLEGMSNHQGHLTFCQSESMQDARTVPNVKEIRKQWIGTLQNKTAEDQVEKSHSCGIQQKGRERESRTILFGFQSKYQLRRIL